MAMSRDDYEVRKKMLDHDLDAMKLIQELCKQNIRQWEQMSGMVTRIGLLELDMQKLRNGKKL